MAKDDTLNAEAYGAVDEPAKAQQHQARCQDGAKCSRESFDFAFGKSTTAGPFMMQRVMTWRMRARRPSN